MPRSPGGWLGLPATRPQSYVLSGFGNDRRPAFDVVEMGAPTLVPSSPRRERVALESSVTTRRRSHGLGWMSTRRALDTMLLCWIGVLVAVLIVLTFS